MSNYIHCNNCGTECPLSVGDNITVYYCPNCGSEEVEDI